MHVASSVSIALRSLSKFITRKRAALAAELDGADILIAH